MKRYWIWGVLLLGAAGVASVAGQTNAPVQKLFAALQKPGAPDGFLSDALKTGTDDSAGFFAVTGQVLRLGNVDYHFEENKVKSQTGQTYSLKDAKGRFLVWTDNGSVMASATPAKNTKWFSIRFFTSAQKTEIENQRAAEHQRDARPQFDPGAGGN